MSNILLGSLISQPVNLVSMWNESRACPVLGHILWWTQGRQRADYSSISHSPCSRETGCSVRAGDTLTGVLVRGLAQRPPADVKTEVRVAAVAHEGAWTQPGLGHTDYVTLASLVPFQASVCNSLMRGWTWRYRKALVLAQGMEAC